MLKRGMMLTVSLTLVRYTEKSSDLKKQYIVKSKRNMTLKLPLQDLLTSSDNSSVFFVSALKIC